MRWTWRQATNTDRDFSPTFRNIASFVGFTIIIILLPVIRNQDELGSHASDHCHAAIRSNVEIKFHKREAIICDYVPFTWWVIRAWIWSLFWQMRVRAYTSTLLLNHGNKSADLTKIDTTFERCNISIGCCSIFFIAISLVDLDASC